MTEEQKQLLLIDLSARLPYGVKCCIKNNHKVCGILNGIVGENIHLYSNGCSTYNISVIKPYLFPLSNMTEEQKNDCPINETTLNIINSNIGCYGIIEIPWRLSFLFIDWCNKNHFDYRGLIPKDLANDATGLNIY